MREFECQSFHQFLAWKEKDEEDNDTFYAQSTGKKPFNDSTNDETGNHFHALEMHELLSSAVLDTDVKIEIFTRINGLSAKLTKKVGKVLRNLECNVHIQLPLVGNNGRVKVIYLPAHTNHTNHPFTIEKEAKSIPLTWSTQAEISAKLQKGISDDDLDL